MTKKMTKMKLKRGCSYLWLPWQSVHYKFVTAGSHCQSNGLVPSKVTIMLGVFVLKALMGLCYKVTSQNLHVLLF